MKDSAVFENARNKLFAGLLAGFLYLNGAYEKKMADTSFFQHSVCDWLRSRSTRTNPGADSQEN